VNITVWHASGDERAVRSIEDTLPARVARFPEGVSGVHIITESAGLPTSGARDALVESARKWGKLTAGVAVVIERAGFWGSALRSAVTGIQMVSKAEFPIRVVGSLREAAQWLPDVHEQRTGVALPRTRFAEALQAARDMRVPVARAGAAAT
jgi:hypothetical protein